MHEHVPLHALLNELIIEVVSATLDSAERCGRAAASGIEGFLIIVIELTEAVGAAEGTLIETVKEDLMLKGIDTDLSLIVLIQTPADVIMTPDVVDEGAVILHRKDVLSHVIEESDVLRSEG